MRWLLRSFVPSPCAEGLRKAIAKRDDAPSERNVYSTKGMVHTERRLVRRGEMWKDGRSRCRLQRHAPATERFNDG